MPRRWNPEGVLAAQVAAAVERGAAPDELVEVARGRADILAGCLARAERGSVMRGPVAEHVERLRAAVELVDGGAEPRSRPDPERKLSP